MNKDAVKIFIKYAKIKVALKALNVNYTSYTILSLMRLKPLKFAQITHILNCRSQIACIHLRGLISAGHIIKNGDFYTLTISGLQYLADINKRLK